MPKVSEEIVGSAVSTLGKDFEVSGFSSFESAFARDVFNVELSSGEELVLYLCTNTSEEYERRFKKEGKISSGS